MSKNKMKTHKASSKRFKITGSGKVSFHHAGTGHNTGKKSARNRRVAKKRDTLPKGMERKVKKSLCI